jgi:chromosome segregation ATPase
MSEKKVILVSLAELEARKNEEIAELKAINDELNERNQKLSRESQETREEHQKLIVTFNKTDRMLGKMINKIGLYESKIMHYEIQVEDMAAEINGYREREKASEVPADDE